MGQDWYCGTNFSLFPWKHHQIRQWLVLSKICIPISLQLCQGLVIKNLPFRAKWSLKVCNSKFMGLHGNGFQLFWIFVHRHPKGNLSWKFQVSSPDSLAASPWVTDFVTERQAIYKLIWKLNYLWIREQLFLLGGGTRIFWVGQRGDQFFFSVGPSVDQNFLRVKEGGPKFFLNFFCAFGAGPYIHYSKNFRAFAATFFFTILHDTQHVHIQSHFFSTPMTFTI